MVVVHFPGTPVYTPVAERRRGAPDRRRTPRGGRRAYDAIRIGAFAALCALLFSSPAAAQMRFGFDSASIKKARDRGMPVSYGSLWAGAWNQRYGWAGIESQLQTAKSNGAIPVVHWWYWGDDISPSCVENGCWDARQGVQKDQATWYRLSHELADLIVRVMGTGSSAMVVVETEFNKRGIESYEPFDGYLTEQARIFHDRNLKVILGFGNWGRSLWKNFDRAVAASDLLGTMVLQSSIHEESTYLDGADMLLDAARYYQTTFGKPSFVMDFAFSSYPEPSYENYQDTVVREIFARMGEFKAAGIQGMVWRMLSDDPNFDTSNYHRQAERHWGLLRADGSAKRAFTPFLNGMLAEAGSAPAPAPAPAPTAGTVSVWWPTQNATLSGTQPFKALLDNWSLSQYKMYWRVDGGQLNVMPDNFTDYPHKEVMVDVSSWRWRGNGPYAVEFIANDLSGNAVGQKKVSIYVR